MWKQEAVYREMINSKYFKPTLFICPSLNFGEELAKSVQLKEYSFFKKNNYNVEMAKWPEDKTGTDIKNLDPDVIFFTKDYNESISNLYRPILTKYLTCYIPYYHNVESFNKNKLKSTRVFFESLWRIFLAHPISKKLLLSNTNQKEESLVVTGYPAMEELLFKLNNKSYHDVWKQPSFECNRVRIIWAPHFSIGENTWYSDSTFLKYADFFKELSIKYKNQITWAFKPHPNLKAKLYAHEDWGIKKTNAYYKFWEKTENTQLEEAGYIDLFCSSDAMIHDSSSFLIEYLYVQKPVMYLINKHNRHKDDIFFGSKAVNSCKLGFSENDIEKFLQELITNKKISITENHKKLLEEDLLFFFKDELPSKKIMNHLLAQFKIKEF